MKMREQTNRDAITDGNMELLSFSGINPEFYIHRTIVQVQDAYSNMSENVETGFIVFILKVRQFEAEMRARDYIPRRPTGEFRNRAIINPKKAEEEGEEGQDPDAYDNELDEEHRIPTAQNYYKLIEEERKRINEDNELDDNMKRVQLAYYKYELLSEIIYDDNKPIKKLYVRG
jgi:hypothetical protein